jgi:hypothetical protein
LGAIPNPDGNSNHANDDTDVTLLIQHLQSASKGILCEDSFIPMSVGRVLAPFLKHLGYGRFTFNPHPFCLFAACILHLPVMHVNDHSSSSSASSSGKKIDIKVPVSSHHLFDLSKLYHNLLPIVEELESGASLGKICLHYNIICTIFIFAAVLCVCLCFF